MLTLGRFIQSGWSSIRHLGNRGNLDEYEKRKLLVFNQLNAIGVICGIAIPLVGLFDDQELPWIASLVACSPALISFFVLFLNARQHHELARMVYFSFYPVLTSCVYAAGLDVGVELFFILCGVLAIFYLRHLRNGIIAFFLSMLCYFLAFVVFKNFSYRLEVSNFPFYVFNHAVAILLIFFSIVWLKRENNGYQRSLLDTTNQVMRQNEVIAVKVEQLSELNTLKNKLFSVISHDLKTPIYALRNLFRNMENYDLPGEDIKEMVPDIVKDLNYTTSLMENLLQWAKSQMAADSIMQEEVDLPELIEETRQLLRLQAEAKKILLQSSHVAPAQVFADREALHLVLRNIISNAIKFTPENGQVTIVTQVTGTAVEVSIQDTGVGMPPEVVEKLSQNNFYTTRGTANESGTGLGLMLCKEFLGKIGGRLAISSEPGKGSTFRIQLSKYAAN